MAAGNTGTCTAEGVISEKISWPSNGNHVICPYCLREMIKGGVTYENREEI